MLKKRKRIFVRGRYLVCCAADDGRPIPTGAPAGCSTAHLHGIMLPHFFGMVPIEAGNIRELLQAAAQYECSKTLVSRMLKFLVDNKAMLAQQGILEGLEGNMLLLTAGSVQQQAGNWLRCCNTDCMWMVRAKMFMAAYMHVYGIANLPIDIIKC